MAKVKTVKDIRKYAINIMGLAVIFPLMAMAILISGHHSVKDPLMPPNHQTDFVPLNITVSTSQALHNAFESEQYQWPDNNQAIPPVVLKELPDDFATELGLRKRQDLFLRALLPIVLIENRRIYEQREMVKYILNSDFPVQNSSMYNWLEKLAQKLRIRGDLNDRRVLEKILIRLDEIPPALALAQGAIETGWGTSRFALEGNSLFGQWTYKSKNGLAPSKRESGKNHFVASFPDLRSSVRAYMHNLNTGRAYSEFRLARAKLRADNSALSAEVLADYLQRYSQRGEDYVNELQRMIRSQRISSIAKASLLKSKENWFWSFWKQQQINSKKV